MVSKKSELSQTYNFISKYILPEYLDSELAELFEDYYHMLLINTE